ncbi:LuxR C-terminal-related transcriptional regulator [Avibacterium sp. 20-15]|uniref:LuxR C-terminal-related transcriptional regulator n=1 Tax=unclassified Avibacterium TaxID=2685287 RepID=UPI0020275720|nr:MULTISPECIES: LuxR C-terminal-related transcriptional regulator [unclassified Avibacterium]MCW9732123.1 LuxR C-terminal-related transcriptional regulator [Avibacterium sp. 20-15]URL04300.1 LuxR C-terminal-related transcriptional regulator [Avibacterium sp. 20-132]
MTVVWSCLVNEQKELIEWENHQGKAYLENYPQLIDYAQALLASKRDNVHFYYQADQQWFNVSLQRYKQRFTLLTAQQIPLPFELSKRELEILTLLSSGLSNAEISQQLFISERTVAKHVEHLFQKTQIDNRTSLAVFAITENLCCLPTPGDLPQSLLATYEIEGLAKGKKLSKKVPHFIHSAISRPITIGVPYVEQGIGQWDTQELCNGSQLAVEMINQQGGIHGRQVRLETVGFRVDDPQSIQQAYQTLFDKEVDAISASYACYSPDLHEWIASKGIPYIHLATHSDLGKSQHKQIKNIFQACASDINYGAGVARFIQAYQYHYPQVVKNKRILVVTVTWQKIDIGIENLIIQLRNAHWYVEVLALEKSSDVFNVLMKQVHHIDPTLIVFASYFAEDILAFYQCFIQNPINAIIYSIYAPSVFLPQEKQCEDVLWASTTGLSMNYAGQKFRQHYQQLFHHQPSYSQASVAYDQIQILANVWRHSTSPRAFREVINGIRSLAYTGVNGTYYFGGEVQAGLTYPDNTKDLSISQPHLLFQIQQGKSTVIAPDVFAESVFRLPHWFRI